jgi:hypothetical protein
MPILRLAGRVYAGKVVRLQVAELRDGQARADLTMLGGSELTRS